MLSILFTSFFIFFEFSFFLTIMYFPLSLISFKSVFVRTVLNIFFVDDAPLRENELLKPRMVKPTKSQTASSTLDLFDLSKD